MKNFIRAAAILCGVSLLPLSVANAASPPNFVAEGARTVAGGRMVEVTLGQAEIRSNINSTAAVAAAGGLIGAMIGASIDSARAKKAEETITPLRDRLGDFDADGLAILTTKNALSNLDWMQASDVKFSKDSTLPGKIGVLDSGEAAQVAFFDYGYQMLADFSTIRVTLSMQFVNKALPENSSKPEGRFKYKNLAYVQGIVADIALPNPDKDVAVNAGRWAADDGRLAKNALTLAFNNVEKLIPRELALSQGDIAALGSKDKASKAAGGLSGRVVEDRDGHLLIWNAGFIQSDSLLLDPITPVSPQQTALAPQNETAATTPDQVAPATEPATGTATDQMAAVPAQAQ